MWITALVLFFVIMLDQVSKYLVEMSGPDGHIIFKLEKFLTIEVSHNTGAAFGMGSGYTWIFVIISFVATIFLGYLATRIDWKHGKFSAIMLTLAFGGCIGNLIDRTIVCIWPNIREGVVDMISFYPFDWFMHLFGVGGSIFNLADAFLIVGLIGFCIDYLFFYEKRARKYGYKNYR